MNDSEKTWLEKMGIFPDWNSQARTNKNYLKPSSFSLTHPGHVWSFFFKRSRVKLCKTRSLCRFVKVTSCSLFSPLHFRTAAVKLGNNRLNLVAGSCTAASDCEFRGPWNLGEPSNFELLTYKKCPRKGLTTNTSIGLFDEPWSLHEIQVGS